MYTFMYTSVKTSPQTRQCIFLSFSFKYPLVFWYYLLLFLLSFFPGHPRFAFCHFRLACFFLSHLFHSASSLFQHNYFVRFCVGACINSSFRFIAEQCFTVHATLVLYCLSIHSHVCGHLGVFPITNNAAMNICVQVFVLTQIFLSLG